MSEFFAEIKRLADYQEESIQERDPDKWQKFVELRDAFVSSTGEYDTEQTDEQTLVKRYIMSSSFIASRFAADGNKRDRDRAAQSFSIASSSFGHNPLTMMEKHIRCEQMWALAFPAVHSRRSNPAIGCLVIVVVGAVIAATIYSVAF